MVFLYNEKRGEKKSQSKITFLREEKSEKKKRKK